MILILAVAPPLLIAYYVYQKDKYDKEPKSLIIKSFLFGCLGIIPAIFLELFAKGMFTSLFLYVFIGIALVEEGVKYFFLKKYLFNKPDFNEPMDGIVYGVTVSLGFATFENYEYVFHWAEQWKIDPYQMAIWRSYSAVPLHGLAGCIMGFYFGKYAFTADKKYLILSLLLPFIVHGFYNFLTYPYHFMIVGFAAIFSVVLHGDLKKLQIHKKEEKEIKKI